MSLDVMKMKVLTLLFDLGLQHVVHSYIGSALNGGGGISTGERKRVHLGIELVVDPAVLVMDEPTSGLDSYNASVLMKVVNKAAINNNVLVIMSIHQPPYQVYKQLDNVLVMGHSGQCAYFGQGSNVISYLASVGFDNPEGQSAAEFIVDLTSNRDDDRLQELTDAYAASEDRQIMTQRIDKLVDGKFRYSRRSLSMDRSASGESEQRSSFNFLDVVNLEKDLQDDLTSTGQSKGGEIPSLNIHIASEAQLSEELGSIKPLSRASFKTQLLLLTSRSFIHMARKPTLFLLTLTVSIVSAGFLAVLFYDLDNEMAGSQSRAGFLFFIIFFFSLTSLSSLAQYAQDRRLYLYETNVNMYSNAAYILSKVPSDIMPLRMLPPLLLGCIVYYPIGFQNDPFKFVNFLMIITLVNMVASSACFVIASIWHDNGTANLVAVCYFVFSMLFGGLFLAEDSVAGGGSFDWLKYLKYGSFFHFGYEAMMTNEFIGLDLNFNEDGVDVDYQGSFFLDLFSIDPKKYGQDVMSLGIMVILLLSAGFLSLRFLNTVKR
jgi:energy-coupling factor transporter ATP-binding protein EcfA2/ABC-type multidrug transport system permease subunit